MTACDHARAVLAQTLGEGRKLVRIGRRREVDLLDSARRRVTGEVEEVSHRLLLVAVNLHGNLK